MQDDWQQSERTKEKEDDRRSDDDARLSDDGVGAGGQRDKRDGRGQPAQHDASERLADCEDESVLGRPFYVMECVPGRVLLDGGASLSEDEKRQLWASLCESLAALHSVDYCIMSEEERG